MKCGKRIVVRFEDENYWIITAFSSLIIKNNNFTVKLSLLILSTIKTVKQLRDSL